MSKTVLLASNNLHKFNELSDSLKRHNVDLRLASEEIDNLPNYPEESAFTFIENALGKAHHVSLHTSLPVIADDSGLCVDALKGAPGVRSSRFAHEDATDLENNQALLKALDSIKPEERLASFYAVLVLVRYANDPLPIIGVGEWKGVILEVFEGQNGFGYDPLFYDPQNNSTAAQMALEIKNQRSHRAKAIESLLSQNAFSTFAGNSFD